MKALAAVLALVVVFLVPVWRLDALVALVGRSHVEPLTGPWPPSVSSSSSSPLRCVSPPHGSHCLAVAGKPRQRRILAPTHTHTISLDYSLVAVSWAYCRLLRCLN